MWAATCESPGRGRGDPCVEAPRAGLPPERGIPRTARTRRFPASPASHLLERRCSNSMCQARPERASPRTATTGIRLQPGLTAPPSHRSSGRRDGTFRSSGPHPGFRVRGEFLRRGRGGGGEREGSGNRHRSVIPSGFRRPGGENGPVVPGRALYRSRHRVQAGALPRPGEDPGPSGGRRRRLAAVPGFARGGSLLPRFRGLPGRPGTARRRRARSSPIQPADDAHPWRHGILPAGPVRNRGRGITLQKRRGRHARRRVMA